MAALSLLAVVALFVFLWLRSRKNPLFLAGAAAFFGLGRSTYIRALQRRLDDLKTGGVAAEAIIVANEPDLHERWLLIRAPATAGATRVRVVSMARESLYTSWNRGVALAENENVAFWNVDDLRNPEAIVEALHLLDDEHRLVMFPYVLAQTGGPGVPRTTTLATFMDSESLSQMEPRRDFVIGPFFVCAKSLLVTTRGFDEQFRIVGDYDWQIRAAGTTAFRPGASIGGLFRADGRNLSSSGSAHHRVEQNIIYRRHAIPERLWELTPQQQELLCSYREEFVPHLPARLDDPVSGSVPGAVSLVTVDGRRAAFEDAARGGGRTALWCARRGSAAIERRVRHAWESRRG